MGEQHHRAVDRTRDLAERAEMNCRDLAADILIAAEQVGRGVENDEAERRYP